MEHLSELLGKSLDVEKHRLPISLRTKNQYYLFTRLILQAVEFIQGSLAHQSMLKSMILSTNGSLLLALRIFIPEGQN